ncbi:nucleotidyltransferase domain-containing protein [Candidatus Thorarchaeota archaeon]|nr:MAG: nucleotidyltransferase domain-containing protein [Candidatus Thorarchaeota archaeon]
MKLETVREQLSGLSKLDVLLFGSYVTGDYRPSSDIDIAILAHTEKSEEMIELKMNLLGEIPYGYDISIFEALPTIIKSGVLENYIVLFGDPLEISEYLRKFWKESQDYKFRFELPSIKEIRENI